MKFLVSARVLAVWMLFMSCLAHSAQAGVLWYNGDYDSRDSLADMSNVPVATGNNKYVLTTSLVYDNFIVPTGQTWTLSNVFANELMSYNGTVSTATWQIRTGVSAGNGGTVFASGDTAATATTNIAYNPATGLTGMQITATVTGVTLTAGEYWVAVAPDSAGYYSDQAFLETTSGANSVGLPGGNDGNSYITNNFPTTGLSAYNFTATRSVLTGDGPNIDFSLGVDGTATMVPEPTSMALVFIGLGLPALVRVRRLASRSA